MDLTPRSLADVYRRFETAYYLHEDRRLQTYTASHPSVLSRLYRVAICQRNADLEPVLKTTLWSKDTR
jgi:hypothetical protein